MDRRKRVEKTVEIWKRALGKAFYVFHFITEFC